MPVADVVAEILKPYKELVSQRAQWETDWRDLATYVMPRKGGVIGKPANPGEKLTTAPVRLDGDPCEPTPGRVPPGLAHLAGDAVVQAPDADARAEPHPVGEGVARRAAGCASTRALQQSNWNAETFEAYLDLGAFGTAVVFMVERGRPTSAGRRAFAGCCSRHPDWDVRHRGGCRGARGHAGLHVHAARRRLHPALRGVRPAASGSCRKAKAKPQEPVEILHWIAPRANGTYGRKKLDKPWKSCYVSEKDKRLLEEGGYDMAPFAAPRWTKASGETYGRGPGHTALPDVRTLNRMTELELRAIAKAIEPPLLARHHGVIGAVRTTPGAITTVRDDPRTALVPLADGRELPGRADQVGAVEATRSATCSTTGNSSSPTTSR